MICQTSDLEIPEFEAFSNERCGPDSHSLFVPLRRESKLGRVLYCFGKASGLKTYVDVFTSWGGGSLVLVGGMSAARNSGSKSIV